MLTASAEKPHHAVVRKPPPHGCKLVYKEVVEALSDYKRFNFWWFGSPACGDLTGNNWIKNNLGRLSLRLVWRRREKWQYNLVCVDEEPSDDSINGSYVDVLLNVWWVWF